MKTLPKFEVHRNGYGKFDETVKNALTEYRRRHGDLPAMIIVNPKQKEIAAMTLGGGQKLIAVKSNNGCLQGEVWLALSNGKKQALQQACFDLGQK